MVGLRLQRNALALAFLLFRETHALSQQYCSSQNTGTNYTPVFWEYQSNGYCHDNCNPNYAFAIVQGVNCWCSNTIPTLKTDVSNCDQPCPGYGDLEKCGSASGLFGYVVVNSDLATSAVASSSTSSTTSIRSTPKPSTSVTPSATISTQVVTLSGSVTTRTVTTTLLPNSNGGLNQSDSNSSLSGGAIAGIAIGVLLGLAVIAIAAFLLWRRRRASEDGARGSTRPRRTTSMLSRTGLLSRGRAPSMTERPNDDTFLPYNVGSGNSARHSMLFTSMGNDNVIVQPASPLGSSHGDSSDLGRRQSRPMVYDQRLNPTALFANPEANGSRVSMQDQHDYSRPLGIANPDPRPSFESRASHG